MAGDLDSKYQETIDKQRDYLSKLQEAFNQHCDQITAEAETQLKAIPEAPSNTEARQQVYEAQKKKLDEALSQLRGEIDRSSRETRKKLEEINQQREESKLEELEQLIQQSE